MVKSKYSLFEVGSIAGWPCHTSLENSKNIIKTILSTQDTYAIVFKEVNHVVGCINIMIGNKSNLGLNNNEGEIGYWIGKEFRKNADLNMIPQEKINIGH